jgi:hypothetical protein
MKSTGAEQAISESSPLVAKFLHAIGLPLAGAGVTGASLEWYVKAISAVYLTLMVIKLLFEFKGWLTKTLRPADAKPNP